VTISISQSQNDLARQAGYLARLSPRELLTDPEWPLALLLYPALTIHHDVALRTVALERVRPCASRLGRRSASLQGFAWLETAISEGPLDRSAHLPRIARIRHLLLHEGGDLARKSKHWRALVEGAERSRRSPGRSHEERYRGCMYVVLVAVSPRPDGATAHLETIAEQVSSYIWPDSVAQQTACILRLLRPLEGPTSGTA